MTRHRPAVLAAACVALLALGKPSSASSQEAHGGVSVVNYADPASWVCRPGACRDDLSASSVRADGSIGLELFRPAANPPIDCFYVYPTVSHGPGLSAELPPTRDERRAVTQQVERFTSVCRLFVPFYRQVTVTSMMQGSSPSAEAAERASRMTVADVEAAWAHYLAHDNNGRGVVLIGHSQGAGLLIRLIKERIEGTPEQARLVSAILPGAGVLVPTGRETGGTFKAIPPCRSKNQIGCVISFNMVRADRPIPADVIRRPEGMTQVCTNPAALKGGAGFLKPYLSTTGETIIPDLSAPQPPWTVSDVKPSTPFVTLPGLYSAVCGGEGAYVAVSVHKQPEDKRTGALTGDWLQDGAPEPTMGLHLIDLNLAAGNLVEILRSQTAAFLKDQQSAARK